LLLRRLLLLHLHLLLHHRRAAAGDLPHAHLEVERAILGKSGWRSSGAECQLLWHREPVLAAFLHPGHRLGEAGEDLVHGERLRAVMGLAAVEHGAVVGGQNIVEQRRIGVPDRLASAGLERSERKTAGGHFRAKRPGAEPGEADSGGNDQQKRQPQRDRPAGFGGTMGGFGDGHWALGR